MAALGDGTGRCADVVHVGTSMARPPAFPTGFPGPADLRTAGASPQALERLMDASDKDIAGRFAQIEPAWMAMRLTGYGEAVSLVAQQAYGLEEVTGEGLSEAQSKLEGLRAPGMRLQLLQEQANLDHVQVDDFSWPCLPDASGPDFFLYDLSWAAFSSASVDWKELATETGIEVVDLSTLNQAMGALFDRLHLSPKKSHSNYRYQR